MTSLSTRATDRRTDGRTDRPTYSECETNPSFRETLLEWPMDGYQKHL